MKKISISNQTKADENVVRILTTVFSGVAILLFSIAGLFGFFTYDDIQNSNVEVGYITEMVRKSEGFSPVIVYRFQGQEYTFQSSVSSIPPRYEVGEKVELLVREDGPADARINGFVELWLASMIIGGIGLVFFSVAIILVVLSFKKRNQELAQRNKGTL